MAIANGTCGSFCNQPKAHFGLPWVRPRDNRGKDGWKEVNAGQTHSSIYDLSFYLQPFTSYSEILVGNWNFFLLPCI